MQCKFWTINHSCILSIACCISSYLILSCLLLLRYRQATVNNSYIFLSNTYCMSSYFVQFLFCEPLIFVFSSLLLLWHYRQTSVLRPGVSETEQSISSLFSILALSQIHHNWHHCHNIWNGSSCYWQDSYTNKMGNGAIFRFFCCQASLFCVCDLN